MELIVRQPEPLGCATAAKRVESDEPGSAEGSCTYRFETIDGASLGGES